ncbi:antibiotic biosynthesis monooxygenase family protein [Streptomyces sp. 549]|uniref:putative quinol monooxygenase n=1 Tax=Streptomyces sp. 549 TaxID=3049076 RepID=UPI0024C32381|nr:antibiotic biosynthesis monooxygenase family protein [Streptomyces sp. 549]MDK1474361.1 antibiotic biosynthesis monooxygenase family protein [Streptomyces sp. 549]
MIIVSGSLHVEPAARDAYVDGCRGIVEQARAAPGCLDFVLAADPLDPGRVNVYEKWESDEALARFRSSDPEGGDREGGDPDGSEPEGSDPEGSDPEPDRAAAVLDAQVWKHRVSAVEPP